MLQRLICEEVGGGISKNETDGKTVLVFREGGDDERQLDCGDRASGRKKQVVLAVVGVVCGFEGISWGDGAAGWGGFMEATEKSGGCNCSKDEGRREEENFG